MGNNYAFQGFEEPKMARAQGRFLPISTKESVEICDMLRRKNLQKAKARLEKVIGMDMPVKFTKYNKGISHMKKMASARYPISACTEILKVLKSVESNALVKNLDVKNLIIKHICAQKAGGQFHYGRKGRRLMKLTHIEIVVEQKERPKSEEPKVNAAKKQAVEKKVK